MAQPYEIGVHQKGVLHGVLLRCACLSLLLPLICGNIYLSQVTRSHIDLKTRTSQSQVLYTAEKTCIGTRMRSN